MVVICRHCGTVYEEDEFESCPECDLRKREAEHRRIHKKAIEQLTFKRMESAKELMDPVQLSDTLFTVISSDGDKCYTVARVKDDKFTCDCPDFRYRKHGQLDCKHIIKVREYLQRQAEEHKEEARAKIESRKVEAIADPGFF